MRRWLTRCAVAAVLLEIALLVVILQLHAPPITVGKPLPSGKVKPQLVSEWDAALLLAPDGSLWAWSGTGPRLVSVFPQLTNTSVPQRVGSDSDWSEVAGTGSHTVASKEDGSLWAWTWIVQGANLTNHYAIPQPIATATNWQQICVGGGHSLALKNDGSLWAWGLNSSGQLGGGTTNYQFDPAMVGTDRDWQAIAAGNESSFALKSNGTVWAWGKDYGSGDSAPKQIESGTNWVAISAGNFGLMALKADGTLWLNYPNSYLSAAVHAPTLAANFTQIGKDSDWADVHAGYFSFFARKQDGSWWVCGQNVEGQLGLGTGFKTLHSLQRLPFGFEPWAFAPGKGTTLLLCKDGRLWTWGRRLGAERSSALTQKLQSVLAPVLRQFPSLGSLIKSDIDQRPYLLWELPTEVRRSLGRGRESSTNNSTSSHPTDAIHE